MSSHIAGMFDLNTVDKAHKPSGMGNAPSATTVAENNEKDPTKRASGVFGFPDERTV